MSESPKVRFGILCEDIRREDNGKLILIGVFGDAILVKEFPALLTLANAVWFDLSTPFDGPLWSQVLLDDAQIAAAKAMAVIEAGRPVMAIQPIPLRVPKEGVLSFQLKFSEDGDWQTTTTVPIRLNPSAGALQQPVSQSPPIVPPS